MKPILNINYLAYRREYFDITAYFLNKLKPENKKKICVSFLHLPGHEHLFEGRLKDIAHQFVAFPNQTYMQKIHWATQQDFEYSVKLDEDCFGNNHLWDYLIENVEMLDDPQNITLAPLLSNGIPTADQFIDEFFDLADKKSIEDIILGTALPHIWGVDYTSLSRYTLGSSEWRPEEYYAAVDKLPHYYRGIHPIRVSLEAQVKLLQLLLSEKYTKKFCAPQDYSISKSQKPYMCNSWFIIKTVLWKQLVNTPELFRDEFDEVVINEYRRMHKMDWLFVNRGFGIHTKYNTRGEQNVEDNFYRDFSREIIL